MTPSSATGPPAWPPVDIARLAEVVHRLAEDVAEPEVRAQVHALSALLADLGAEEAHGEERRGLQQRLVDAMAAEDEGDALATLRHLAQLNRPLATPVDWTAASGG